MTTRVILCCLSIMLIALVTAPLAGAAGKANAPAIDPRAAQMVRQMADYLTGLNEFAVQGVVALPWAVW